MTSTTTVMIEYRGIRFVVECAHDSADPLRYGHVSIKPEGDDADFLAYYQGAGEWAVIDRLIDQQMQQWISTREACGYDDAMDKVHSDQDDADIDRQVADAEEARR